MRLWKQRRYDLFICLCTVMWFFSEVFLCDQLFPVKVDNVKRTAILDEDGRIRPGTGAALGKGNKVDNRKAYGSMVVFVTRHSDAKKLISELYFIETGAMLQLSLAGWHTTMGPR